MKLFIRSLVFTILVPGTVTIYIPYRIITGQYDSFSVDWNVLQFLSILVFVIGASIYFWCLWDFARTGRGTPAIYDAPKRLVVKGLYRYVRNPMYFGVLFVILGWAALYESYAALRYAILMWVIFHIVVVLIEEPTLRRQFDESYGIYCKRVRRWIPGRAYKQTA